MGIKRGKGTNPEAEGAVDPAEGWIFTPDAHTLPTEKLPDREEFEKFRRQQADLAGPSQRLFAPPLAPDHDDPESVQPARVPAETTEIAAISPTDTGDYARSGSTPTEAPRAAPRVIPERFRDLSGWDALRDLLAVLVFGSVFATPFTQAWKAIPTWIPQVAAGIGVLTIAVVYVLRWWPVVSKKGTQLVANFSVLGVIRKVGMLPALVVALGSMAYDLAVSIPKLLTPLPDGPDVGLGAGVALLLLGAVVGSERRAFEGHIPAEKDKARAATIVAVAKWAGIASFVIALVMMVGKAINGDHLFALVTFSNAVASLALFLYLVNPRLREKPSWYVFLVGAGGAMVIGAAADTTLRLDYAAPASFSTAFVWLPMAFAAFGVLISRAYVRSTPLRFARVDWIMYAARIFEFSIMMHTVAIVSNALFALAVLLGYDAGLSVTLALANLVVLLVFLFLSSFARRALLHHEGLKARAHAVAGCVGMTVLGFVSILVYTLASGEAAGLTNGGLAFIVGIVAALMLTVPTPLRDDYGVPDLDRTFAEFRARSLESSLALKFVPPTANATAQHKAFPVA